MSTPDSILTSIGLAPIPSAKMLVTPTGGSQVELGDALATATGGAGSFTTLTASSTVTLSPANKDVTIAPSGSGKAVIGPAAAGTINNMSVGVTTPLAGKFTTLAATDAVTFSPVGKDVTLSPSTTGKVVIGPNTAGTINNMSIGVTTPLAGKFTTVDATGAVTLSPASAAVAISPTGTGTVAISPAGALTINPTAASTIDNASIGVTTPAAGKFTTITSATDGAITLTSQTDGASNKLGTLANSPIVGDPTVWVPVSINGKSGWVPFWSA